MDFLAGLRPNVAGTLAYALGWVSGLLFLLFGGKNRSVRFHALQSIFLFGGLSVLGLLVGFIPTIGAALGSALSLLALICWIFLMVKTYQNEQIELPVVGKLAKSKV